MESRLPRPKINLRKAISSINVSSELDTETENEPTKSLNSLKSTSASNVNGLSEKLQKAKSSHNISTKPVNENRPPSKPTMIRSKTLSTITRTAVKRPATVTNAVDVKRPNVRPAPRAVTAVAAPHRLNRNVTAVANKTVVKATSSSNPAANKPSKWDLKGRLAYANEELTSIKEKHKEAVAKNNTLRTEVDTWREKEKGSRSKAEKFELLNAELTKEVADLSTEATYLREKNRTLEQELHDLEDKFNVISASLETCREQCKQHEEILRVETNKVQLLNGQVDSQRSKIAELSGTKEKLQNMVHLLDKDRRQLHNMIQELKGNIRVFCRVRPKIEKENGKGSYAISFTDECSLEVGKSEAAGVSSTCGGRPRGNRQEFSFDKVFPPTATQADIFEELSLLVQSALEGYNVCVFAYGQTGSGKTYTMDGYPGTEYEGMIPRTVKHIFEEKKQFELLGWDYRIEASFLEIYNEHIVDLLDSQPKTHEIRMVDSKSTDIYVTNLCIEEVQSPKELEDCLKIAQKNRAVAATQSNERSSRSHSVTRIKLIGTHEAKGEVCVGTLNLVDLAGSERLRNEEVARTTETKNINKSLANLGNVILALLKKQDHVPYRNSKLTHLLMPSLGGNSKTLMLLNISPLDECYMESLNSLRFASNVNNCKTGHVKRTRTVMGNST